MAPYFRQLLAGRDFAESDPVARQMVNFVYAIGDRDAGQALLVDPAYDVGALLDLLEADGMSLAGVLITHYHADHAGGSLMGWEIAGLVELLELVSVPVHVNAAERPWVARSTGVSESELVGHDSGESLAVGEVEIELLHTPGHTPGSQCFLVSGETLISGDTLFLQGCGRTDLPGSDPDAMYESLRRLATLADGVTVFPGHRYSEAPNASMRSVREENVALQPLR
ncbi:MAG: MBL fold metallo-hydrolase, partial [Acidimicrobiaceae bacterium]|nr:MBL fold metallo-hydrolase [Acidimicrobiaceae bacterium]